MAEPLTQEQLDYIRKGALLGRDVKLSDITDSPAEQVRDVYQQMSVAILKLVDEVERLNAGLRVASGALEEIKRAGDDSVKDPSLSWYEDDRHHDKKVEFGMEAEDILHAMDRAMDS